MPWVHEGEEDVSDFYGDDNGFGGSPHGTMEQRRYWAEREGPRPSTTGVPPEEHAALAQRHAALLEAAKDLATKIDWYAKDSVGQHPKLSEPLAKVRALLASEPVSS